MHGMAIDLALGEDYMRFATEWLENSVDKTLMLATVARDNGIRAYFKDSDPRKLYMVWR